MVQLTVMFFRVWCLRVSHHFSEWRAQRPWPREQTMTVYLQRASTVYHMVKTSDFQCVYSKTTSAPVILPVSIIILVGRQNSHPDLYVLLDMGSQCNQSPSPRPHTDTSNPASWSRHLIQQTLMDEGLRLARMVSHDRAGKIRLGSEGTRSSGDFLNNDLTILCV